MLLSGFLATTFRFAFNGVNRKSLVKKPHGSIKVPNISGGPSAKGRPQDDNR
jgi:hypothetical protein